MFGHMTVSSSITPMLGSVAKAKILASSKQANMKDGEQPNNPPEAAGKSGDMPTKSNSLHFTGPEITSHNKSYCVDPEALMESSIECFAKTLSNSQFDVQLLKAEMRTVWDEMFSNFDGLPISALETVPRRILGGLVMSAAHTRYKCCSCVFDGNAQRR